MSDSVVGSIAKHARKRSGEKRHMVRNGALCPLMLARIKKNYFFFSGVLLNNAITFRNMALAKITWIRIKADAFIKRFPP